MNVETIEQMWQRSGGVGTVRVEGKRIRMGTWLQRLRARIAGLRWLIVLPGEACIRVRKGNRISIQGCHLNATTREIRLGESMTVRIMSGAPLPEGVGRIHVYEYEYATNKETE